MNWLRKSNWAKGSILVAGFFAVWILYLLFAIHSQVAFVFAPMILATGMSGPSLSNLLMAFIASLVPYALVGAIAGAIIGKFSKKGNFMINIFLFSVAFMVLVYLIVSRL